MNRLKKKLIEIYVMWEAKRIWKEVEADEELKREEIHIPKEVDEKVFAAIREIERKERECEEKERFDEEQELIRLGRIYKRNLNRRKYVILAAILILSLAFGINCFGSVDRMFHKLNLKIHDRDREVVDTEGIKQLTEITEEDAFAKIEKEYGFQPVRFGYYPADIEFLEMNVYEDVPKIDILYGKENNIQIKYDILINYRNISTSKDIEDLLINSRKIQRGETVIELKEYLIDRKETRWLVQFEYKEFYYWITITDIEAKEVEKIIENLHLN